MSKPGLFFYIEVKKSIERLEKILTPALSEVPFRRVVRRLKTRAGLLDELREALRLTQKRFSGREGESEVKALTPGQAEVQRIWPLGYSRQSTAHERSL
jgi:hypothetical protein